MIKTFRISKTSMKEWQLHGPVDQALKTTIQAEAVRVIPITVPIGETSAELELWIDASEEPRHGTNAAATMILAIDDARKNGKPLPPQAISTLDEDTTLLAQTFTIDPEVIPIVRGPAVLTGPGATDVPDCHGECLLHALIGQ